MTQEWNFTDLEFKVLWERHTDTRLPQPFMFTSRTQFLDQYEWEKYRTWEQLRDSLDSSFIEVLETCFRPEVYVVVYGWVDQDMDNPETRIRVRAVRAGTRGYVITQLPGETLWHSGGYKIVECGPHGLAEAVVAALPEVSAGRRGNFAITADQQDDLERFQANVSLVSEDSHESASEQHNRFFRMPATTTGAITVNQGRSMFGPRGIGAQIMLWRDLVDDGRYLIELNQAPVAIGTGRKRLTTTLDTAISDMVERTDTHWESVEARTVRRW
ncbi:ESX secretion-associated protein EspG [Nocardia callitridis]|uniref:ESX secretion-associated protein EspG n=1 Tax=Nocardia callitridis TaxID=648753 RepID=A0ABP9KZT3_9NOCA